MYFLSTYIMKCTIQWYHFYIKMTVSVSLHSFVYIQISIWSHFPSAWRISFNISYIACLLIAHLSLLYVQRNLYFVSESDFCWVQNYRLIFLMILDLVLFCFSTLKLLLPLFDLHFFLWEVSCHFYLFYLLIVFFFFLGCFKYFLFFISLKHFD